jgi:putative hydrolase of the HAD superfamily
MPGVIFDLDDTLYPRERFVRSGLAAVAHHAEQQFAIPAMRAFTTMLKASASAPGTEFESLCQTFGLRQSIVPELLQVFRTHRPELWLSATAADTLQELRASGCRIAVLTNGLPHVQAAKVHALGLPPLVDHIIYAAEYAEQGKPHRAAFDEAVRRLGLSPHECVMVGDDETCDMRGGREAGLRTVRLRRTDGDMATCADAVVDSLAQVPSVVFQLLPMVTAHAA